jgi:hypothetical protein
MLALSVAAALYCVAIIAGTLLMKGPIPYGGWLLLALVPLVGVGIVAVMVLTMINRSQPRRRGDWDGAPWNPPPLPPPPSQPRALPRGALVLAAVGVLVGLTTVGVAAASGSRGSPASPTASCRYRLVVTKPYAEWCVTKEEYERAGAAEQQVGSGMMLAFFAGLGGLARVQLAPRVLRPSSPHPIDPPRRLDGANGRDVHEILRERPPT